MDVSIRPSPKGEGNHFANRFLKVSSQFQSAFHPKVKGIVKTAPTISAGVLFQSALHPKVKGICCDGAYKKLDHSMPKAGVIPAIGIETKNPRFLKINQLNDEALPL